MTRTVCPCTDPCFASLSIPESSGAMRENRPASEGLLQRCPKAMLLANTSTKPRRLPQAALWRSWRPGGLRNFCVRTIKSHPFVYGIGERSHFVQPYGCTATANHYAVNY